MGYYAKDGSYVREDGDGPNIQYQYVEPGLSSPGRQETEEEAIKRMEAMVAEKRNKVNPNVPGSNNIYDAGEETIKAFEAMVAEKRAEEKPVYEKLNALIINGIPDNYENLKNYILNADTREEYTGIREDYVQYLLQNEKRKLNVIFDKIDNNISPEAVEAFNKAIFEYLAIINALQDLGAEHLVESKDYYDAYYEDLELSDIMTKANQMQKQLGTNIMISIPKGYDINDPQQMASINQIINNTKLSVESNEYADYMWQKIGYVDKSEEKSL